VELCELGDKLVKDATAAVYNKGKIDKGLAFPTCISVNNCVGHFSPLGSECTDTLKDGDIVKIDLGCHIDGFIAVVATTVAVGQSVVEGKAADVIMAARTAAEAAVKMLKPGGDNENVTRVIQKIADIYGCQPVEGVLSHQMKRFVIDGNKVILNKSNPEHKVEIAKFEENEVYGVDIVMSTGDGKARELDARTTVFKRAVDQNYQLKMKASRYIFNEINQKYPTMPFTIREFEEQRARMGVVECVKHELLTPYPVLYEKADEIVAHVKLTVLVSPTNTMKITSGPMQEIKSEKVIEDEEIKSILASSTKRKAKKDTAAKVEGAK
jgi:curved DNA binding protein